MCYIFLKSKIKNCLGGETGRRRGLKIPSPHGRGGSSPPPGTNGSFLTKSKKGMERNEEL